MQSNRWNRMFAWTTMVLLLIGCASLAQGLTADDILDRMDTEADALAEGSMIMKMRFDNAYSDGTTASNTFAGLSKPGKSLVYFLEPEDVQGTIFLTLISITPQVDPRVLEPELDSAADEQSQGQQPQEPAAGPEPGQASAPSDTQADTAQTAPSADSPEPT